MKPVALVLGASGHLGGHLCSALAGSHRVVAAHGQRPVPGGHAIDLGDLDRLGELIQREAVDVIVLTAAISGVAACERNPERARQVNLEPVERIARRWADRTIVFFSSDAVFDGSRDRHAEDDPRSPSTVYGQLKARAEDVVGERPDHLVIRSARFYGPPRGNGKFVDHVIRTLEEGGAIEAPRDTPGNPTYVPDLAEATVSLLTAGRRGTFHLAGLPVSSLYETACEVARVFERDPARIRAMARDHGSDLPRACAVLDLERARLAGFRPRSLADGLRDLRATLGPGHRQDADSDA